MPGYEWEKLKEALRKPLSPEAMKEAADRFREYQAADKSAQSKPTLVSLGYKKDYPTSIPVDDIPTELERNPAFFEHVRKIVESG